MKKVLLFGFVCGALSVVIFHQGTAFLMFHHAAKVPALADIFGRWNPPFNVAPVPPFGVPTIASQAFWGGLWGIALAAILRATRVPDLATGFVFGAVVVTLTAFTLVAQLKGLPMFAGGNQQVWWRAGLLNGAWGFGTVFLLRPFQLQVLRYPED
ncbi:MAG: hypothetical protein K2X11_19090 [Acetobacteraceae bacterium]|nr:hypothetical protein [Acetobacteraceae bacterium]